MIGNWILYVVGILTVPLGILLGYLTRDEKTIYTKFFPAILWILAILSVIFFTININNSIATIYLFLTILSWNYFDIIFRK